jgi:hypothetical protein
MSDQLYPEDILSARTSLRALAKDAKEAADYEQAKEMAAEADDLIADIWEFVAHTLGLPEHLLEDVQFTVDQHSPQRARVNWTMDGLSFRSYYAQGSGERSLHVEVKPPAPSSWSGGSGWRTFRDLASLGRLIG